ncbi:MAG: HD domain-containing phosphohydrolase [Planctomycetota bacterium]|nr:HD domain-containing phosphohydrolase [Planctomycetota bacterium]
MVDDEAEVLANLQGMLEQAGHDVTATSSLQEALQAIERQSFQLILSDLYLGDSDLGYQIAEVASNLEPRIPVVMLTGRPTFSGAAEALQSRVAAIVAKPVQPQTLLETCRRTVEEHELRTLNSELQAQNRVLAEVLPRAIEVKDPTTSGHAERVVNYTDNLAQRCGVSDEDRASLRLASLLHDVGKIGIPDAILTKPGSLTPDEREVINRHPAMGYEILAPLKRHENVRRWVYQHHERWDGKGYPEGLAGEDVGLPGRILILAEVYDALAEKRSYKKAWETSRITELFRQQAGRQFDPDLAHLVADGLDQMGGNFFSSSPGMLF